MNINEMSAPKANLIVKVGGVYVIDMTLCLTVTQDWRRLFIRLMKDQWPAHSECKSVVKQAEEEGKGEFIYKDNGIYLSIYDR